MDRDHFIEKCIHGRVFRQCVCVGPKTERVIECWHDACVVPNLRVRIDVLESQLADRDAEIDRLRRDKARLEAAVAAVVNIHGPNHDPDGWAFCNHCRDDYKCPTVCAIDAVMGEPQND